MNAKFLKELLRAIPRWPRHPLWWASTVGAISFAANSLGQSGRASAPYIWRHGYDSILADSDLVYAEVQVEASVAGSYYCAIGGEGFYMGLQEGGAGYNKHVHFSVWDPAGDIFWKDPEVVAQRFGGEGTGWATYWPFEWQTNVVYKLYVRLTPDGNNTLYQAFFFDPGRGKWKHLVSIPRPVANASPDFFYSFNEDFGARHWLARSYLVGNEWARTSDGQWVDLSTGLFDVALGDYSTNAFDADVVGRWFRLETGGDTTRDTEVGTVLVREPGVQPNVPFDDLDQDGLPDKWELAIVQASDTDSIRTVEDVLPEHDFDFDRRSNAMEYLDGTDPTVPEFCFAVSEARKEAEKANREALRLFFSTNRFYDAWVTKWAWDIPAADVREAKPDELPLHPGAILVHPAWSPDWGKGRLSRLVDIPTNGVPVLAMTLKALSDCYVAVYVNTNRVWEAPIVGDWLTVCLDLRDFAGQRIQLEIVHTIGGPASLWYYEHLWLDDVDLLLFSEAPANLVRPARIENNQACGWWEDWSINNNGAGNSGVLPVLELVDGKSYVIVTHPPSPATPCTLQREYALPTNNPCLRLVTRAASDFEVWCWVDDVLVRTNVIGPVGWTTNEVDLSAWAGSTRTIRVEHRAGPPSSPWWYEHAYWAELGISEKSPAGPRFTGVTFNQSDGLVLRWDAGGTNLVYTLESASSLQNPVWAPVAPVNQWRNPMTSWTNREALTGRQGFFRLKAEPR
jgi:hypothetical protein